MEDTSNRVLRKCAFCGRTEREVAFLTVHSMLHLLGYDHETSEEDDKDMFARQENIISLMGLTRK